MGGWQGTGKTAGTHGTLMHQVYGLWLGGEKDPQQGGAHTGNQEQNNRLSCYTICRDLVFFLYKQCCESMTFWVWIWILIWIRGSMPLTNGSGSCYFRHWPSRCKQKTNLKKVFLLITFWRYIYIIFCLVIEGSVAGFGSGSATLDIIWLNVVKSAVRELKCVNIYLWWYFLRPQTRNPRACPARFESTLRQTLGKNKILVKWKFNTEYQRWAVRK